MRVDFIRNDGDFSSLHDTFHEEYAGDDQSYFDGNCQVEDNSEEESNQQYGDIGLRILQ